MMDALTTLDRAKRASTGVGISPVGVAVAPICKNRADFSQLVSEYYKFFREELSDDVVFLRRFKRCRSADAFDEAIHKLRTGSQHSTNVAAQEFYEAWLSTYPSPQAAADALFELLSQALVGLAHNAVLVVRDEQARGKWREIASTDISTIMLSVMDDLGLSYSAGKRGWFVRQVEGRLKIDPGTGPREAIAMDYCVQVLVSQNGPLPVSYVDVLAHLGLLNDIRAEGAVLVAYSVASVEPTLRGAPFLERVEKTWRVAAAF
jgi:hypothetical protein